MCKFLVVDVDGSRASDFLVFWAPNQHGYTSNVDRAGRYSAEEVAIICKPYKSGSKHNYGAEMFSDFPMTIEEVEKCSFRVCDRNKSKWAELMKEGKL